MICAYLRVGMAMRAGSLLAVALAASDARADIVPNGSKVIDYSYEVTNLAQFPDVTFVVWPRTCGSGGEPLGAINYVDPSEKERHVIDYEVLEPGRRELLKYCAASSRVYALDAKAYPTDERVADKDDWALAWTKGKSYLGVKAIDAMTIKDRVPFFASARHSDYAFAYVVILRHTSPIKAIHDVLTIKSVDAGGVVVAPLRVRYTYEGGKSEELAWSGGKHPRPPGDPDALKQPQFGDPDAEVDLAADADAARRAEADAGPSVVAAPTPGDPPSTWPVRVGIGALLVGLGLGIAMGLRRKGSA
jgi:hypothetical protein